MLMYLSTLLLVKKLSKTLKKTSANIFLKIYSHFLYTITMRNSTSPANITHRNNRKSNKPIKKKQTQKNFICNDSHRKNFFEKIQQFENVSCFCLNGILSLKKNFCCIQVTIAYFCFVFLTHKMREVERITIFDQTKYKKVEQKTFQLFLWDE